MLAGDGYRVGAPSSAVVTIRRTTTSLPGAPTIDSVTASAGQLTAAWSAPSDPGYSDGTDASHTDNAVTAYDVRHIPTSAADKSDSRWTVVDDAWTAGGGNLEYAIASLTNGQSYDVQVRAVTRAGDGPWSGTSTGTPTADGTPSLSGSLLVGNRAQIDSTQLITVRGADRGIIRVAQQFTTGSNAGGYTLSEVEWETVAGGSDLGAFIYSSSSGRPGSSLHTLTRDSTGTGVKTYTAPANAILAASTSYFVVLVEGSGLTRLRSTTDYREDAGSASGWSINNARHFRVGSGNWGSNSAEVIEIAIRGAARAADTTAPSLSVRPRRR